MPEIKHTFVKGRMNKDFDERLVPNGEYRDALNIEVSTSESSNVGALENIKGNTLKSLHDHNGDLFLNDDTDLTGTNRNAFTVGSYVDESEQRIFNFIHKASDFIFDGTYASGNRLTGYRSDVISMFTAVAGTESGITYPLVTDVYEARIVPSIQLNDNFITGVPSEIISSSFNVYLPKNIREGMRVRLLGPDGTDAYGGEEIYVTSVLWHSDPNLTRVYFTPNNLGVLFDNALLNTGFVFQFTSERILNFESGIEEIEDNVSGKPTSYTPKGKLITAINYENQILFYTDGRTEPKRIPINDFLVNGEYNQYSSVDSHSIVRYGQAGLESYLKEENITVIRKNPRLAPTIIATSTRRTPSNILGSSPQQDYSSDIYSTIYQNTSSPSDALFSFMNANQDDVVPDGTVFSIKAQNSTVHWLSGDTLQLTGNTTAATARVKITSAPTGSNVGVFEISLIDIDESYFPEGATAADAAPEESWNAILVDKQKLWPDSFLYFAYRYKYNNKEYSAISPYSKAVFIPNFYAYNAITGFNVGMENQLRHLKIIDFVEDGIGDDVESVEILMKTSNSENVYIVKEIKRTDSEWSINAVGMGHNKGEYVIEDVTFGRTLDSMQLLRPFDAVPVKAKAQEFSSNRLLYANHTQGYDMLDTSLAEITPDIDFNILKTDVEFTEVISINTFAEASGISNVTSSTSAASGFGLQDYSFNSEITDDGNNFNLSDSEFVVPVDGDYTINWSIPNASVSSVTFNDIGGGLGPSDDISGNMEIFVQANGSNILTNYVSIGSGFLITPIYSWSSGGYDLSVQGTVTLNAGDVVTFHFDGYVIGFTPIDNIGTNDTIDSTNATMSTGNTTLTISGPPVSADIISSKPFESVKSLRNYQVGVVYGDYYGRESEVLIDSSNLINVDQQYSITSNKITSVIKHKFPYWADYYKFFVKEISPEYYNLVLHKAYPNDGDPELDTNNDPTGFLVAGINTVYYWLSFNSIDRNKLELDDYLVLKKVQSENKPPLDANTNAIAPNVRWRVLDIVSEAESNEDGDEFSVKGVALNASKQDVQGKFFVKIEADENFDDYIGYEFSGNAILNGAVFEVEKRKTIDLDLFYEASQAYPIKLEADNVHQYVKVGCKLECGPIIASNFSEDFNNTDIIVSSVVGARSLKSIYDVSSYGYHNDHFVMVDFTIQGNSSTSIQDYFNSEYGNMYSQYLSITPDLYTFRLSQADGSSVTLRVVEIDTVNNTLKAIPYSHPYNVSSTNEWNAITLPWFNCYAFGNGVESDRIRDDFNSDVIYSYTANGKQSGFKASLPISDLKAKYYPDELIFSQIFNNATNTARYNEFIMADNITKRINSEYGSIQKLYTRDSDVLAFCENKVLKILAEKDALFNADGNPQLLSSTNVLGEAIPFIGDYGISTNPESFAVEEYRIYFTDKTRGAVCRLSRDGITPISDAGMKDWFNDNLETASVLIGSYDGKKGEYNLTIHSSTNPNYKKNVYTLSYSEEAKGWVSFKSFIKESGLSMSNEYFTFKNGDMYLHHPDQTEVERNNFYGTQYESTVDVLFNDISGSVKLFKTINYEGTQSKKV